MVGCCPFSFYLEGKEVTPMMEFLLMLLMSFLKVFSTALVTACVNKLVNDFGKKRKRATQRRRKQGSSKAKK
ncbi:hypothetical protein COK81_17240 [Bacillus thuringiensis]|uniref:Uncharacterized protein n=2 Tax=Bacillus cereus group TaxID=86661 RepID=A0A9X7AZ42_BACTU|nr:hypothetical protein COK81_17240 [Bacillus thuringiensis]